MKLAYIYPESLPDTKARAISVMQTTAALQNVVDATLLFEEGNNSKVIKKYWKPLKKSIGPFRSNKVFHLNLKRHINKHPYDVYYVRHLKSAAFLLKYRKHAKIIFECHEIFSVSNPKVLEIEKFVYENADGLVFINETLEKEFMKRFDIEKLPRKVIHNGCNFRLPYIEKDFSSIDSMIYVGNFYPWKGVDFLIESLPHLPGMRLDIVGDGDRKSQLDQKAKALGVEERVVFLGYKTQNEIKELLSKRALAVIPNTVSAYNFFSSPIKLYEYMAASSLVLASDMPTIQEIIQHKKNGFLFETGNMDSFVKVVKKILNMDPKELKKVTYNAYETSKSFTWENRACQIADFAKEILDA